MDQGDCHVSPIQFQKVERAGFEPANFAISNLIATMGLEPIPFNILSVVPHANWATWPKKQGFSYYCPLTVRFLVYTYYIINSTKVKKKKIKRDGD